VNHHYSNYIIRISPHQILPSGSGKTYSIFGEGAGNTRGLLPRSIEYVFEKIEELSERKEIGEGNIEELSERKELGEESIE
jgi:hypothetical protein